MPMFNELTVIRVVCLYVPTALAVALWLWHQRRVVSLTDSRRMTAALIVATAWNTVALFVVHTIAVRAGWWQFMPSTPSLAGIPLEAYFGWIVLWGIVPTLAAPVIPLPLMVGVALWLDVVGMPRLGPMLVLNSSWWIGEAVSICVALIPSQLLARWTLHDTHLGWRSVLQAVTFSGLMLLVIPSIAMEQTGDTWAPLLERSAAGNNILFQLMAIPAVLGLSAVQEFVSRGRGTPLPYDPTRQLVTTGAYSFIANPMQFAMALAFAVWALMLQSWWLLAASVMAVAFSAGLAAWHEDAQLVERFGNDWAEYRRRVRRWWPRWRPVVTTPARLYVAQTCDVCAGVGLWISKRHPTGLTLVAAESHPTRDLQRMTYESEDGHCEDGVAAFARTLEHINLAYAWVGMFVRLPGCRTLIQLIVDASGGGKRSIPRTVGT
jgi:protein-S-isoprenylcysteine O-methyltransferase Ste14